MSSNLKRGPLDSFFSPRQKKSNSDVDIAVAGPYNEENNDIEDNDDRVVGCDPNITEVHKSWPVLWTNEQVTEFQNKNPWIDCKDGKLRCSTCIQVKNSIQLQKSITDGKLRMSREWIDFEIMAAGSNRTNQLSSLRSKIKQHSESKSHILAENVLKKGSEQVLDRMFEHMSETVINSSMRIFQTAYCLAKHHRPFLQFEELIKLQKINGLDMGSSLHSRITATRIINVIAKEMRQRLITRLIESNSKFTIMIDESTTLSTKCTLILYILSNFDSEIPIVVFLDLIELDGQDAVNIEKALWLSLEKIGIPKSFALKNWIAFASDGASVMTGTKSGVVAAKLCEKIPRLFTWHCLCHRLELSVHDVIKDVQGVSRFQSLMDKLYSYYHQSPKSSRALDEACLEVGIEMKKIGRILNVRWSASSFRTIKAIWENYPGIHKHMSQTFETGLKKKIRIFFFS